MQQQVDAGKTDLAQKQQDAQLQAQKVAALRKQVGQAALAQFQDRDVDTAAQLFLTRHRGLPRAGVDRSRRSAPTRTPCCRTTSSRAPAWRTCRSRGETELAALETEGVRPRHPQGGLGQEAGRRQGRADHADGDSSSRPWRTPTSSQTQDAQTLAESALGTTPATTPATTADDPGSSKGLAALAFAKNQLGKPYRFGATGPGAYDCSGLTMSAWKAAGVSLNRTSQAQFRNGRAVSQLRPAAGRPRLLLQRHQPRRALRRQRHRHPRPAPRCGRRYPKLSSMPFAGRPSPRLTSR